jgi:glycosyltransferase involved in cell wall biosynthesis
MPPTERQARIAVVIPTYNRSATVLRAVDSVLASSEPALELVVVDDGSTDGTAAAIAGRGDPRLTYLRLSGHSNGNVARNRGIAATRAPLVAFLDSDDEFLPGRVERLLRFFDGHPGIDAVLDDFAVELAGRRRAARQPPGEIDGAGLTRLLVGHGLPLTCSAISARRTALAATGGFDEGLLRQQDRDLMLRLAGRARVMLGTGADVLKHQSADSFSRLAPDYVAGLDALVARHPVFLDPANRPVLAYLSVRGILRAFLTGRPRQALAELGALRRAQHLPFGFLEALGSYPAGRGIRRTMQRRSGGPSPAGRPTGASR